MDELFNFTESALKDSEMAVRVSLQPVSLPPIFLTAYISP